jgi:hypothetical protein
MLDMNGKDAERIKALAHSLVIKERRFVLFCGSGVSKDAGIPTGWDILLETLKMLRHRNENQKLDYSYDKMEVYYNENYKNLTYSKIIEQTYPYPEDQRSFLQSKFEGKKPGPSHKLIAKWVKSELIKFIITTNFDNCLEKALDEEGLEGRYSKISSGDDALNSEPWPHVESCRIYKIHGTIEKGRIRNTEKDLEDLDDGIRKDILRIIDTHGVIVLGYSGDDKAVMDIFEKRELRNLGFYWTIHTNRKKQVIDLLNKQNGKFICIDNAFKFLDDVLNEVIFIKEKTKTILALEAEIANVEKELDHWYNEQEYFLYNEETASDHIELMICQNKISCLNDKLSKLNEQKRVLE